MTVRVELCVREESGGLEVTVSGLSPGESIVDSVDADAVVRLNETWNSLLSHFSGHGRSTGEMAEFGAAMSRALLSKPAAQSLSWLLTRSLDRRESFLLRLHLHAPLASGLPWELLNLEETGPIALCPNANVVRELCPDGSTETPPDTLRVLVAYANPATARFPYLAHADDEVLQLGELLGRERHRLDLERLPNAGPATLARMLRRLRPHMVHLIGHARRSPGGGEFVLQGGREEDLVGADELAEWLIGSGVRCVFLSACDTAGGVRALAETLVAAGVPSVIGMQSPVRDEVQTALVGEFYREMLRGKTLAESLSFARRSRRHDSGWWIPVLATRSPAARLVPPPPSEVDAQLPGNNLPLHDRPCVGRSAYLGELAGAVLHDGVRYVALCGIGGIGKTRLATELMTRLAPEFADGAWVVDCSAPESMDHVGAATAALFGARLTQADIAADLGEQLKAKQAMILFDSAEKFVPHGLRSFVERVCAKCPGLVCFVTSRVSLGWSADREIVLRPLSIPESDESGGEAIDMFVQVARASDRSLQISTEETGAVADICRLVDGIPLAIQLAAARLRHLSITELRDFVLANVTAALEDASSTSETRLSQVVDASIGALEATDVRTLARLTVFVGGFYLNDAAKVLEQTDPDMLNALVRLTSHSVLEVTRVGSKPRYRLLDIVGERARVLAGSDFLVEFAQADSTRHAQRYAELCAQLTKTGENLQTLSEWMWREIGNVRAAFGFAIEHELTPEISLFAQNLAVHFFEAGAWD
ncbi:MAG TPA: CHAT domain-containing protein, partial [Fimbriimonadaceae bacterium]|nr:CHAT domain-containing protein [Fimbriimonadaceae bacterium]